MSSKHYKSGQALAQKTQSRPFLNILKRIRLRMKDKGINTCVGYTEGNAGSSLAETVDQNSGQCEAHIPSQLLRAERGSFGNSQKEGRNSYNMYPLLEKQEIEKALLENKKSLKKDNHKNDNNLKSVGILGTKHRLPRLKENKINTSWQKVCHKVSTYEDRLHNVLCCINNLKSTLKVNQKKLNRVETKEEASKDWENRPPRRALKLQKQSKHETPAQGLSCWDLADDQNNSQDFIS